MADKKTLWTVKELNLNIGKDIIFNNAEFAIYQNEHAALVGRNGSGKSTLLRIIGGKFGNVSGNFAIANNLRIAMLNQDFMDESDITIHDYVKSGLSYYENLLKRYEDKHVGQIEHEEIEHILTLNNSWNIEQKLDTVLTRLELDGKRTLRKLSGGEKRKIALAQAISGDPDLLLLDEPTNHLDVEAISWIENFLASFRGSCLFVTHDRYFLDRLADRVIELDNGKFYNYEGSYADFISGKMERETLENISSEKRRQFLNREVEWIRRSPKARLKRNLGRVKKFDELSSIAAPVRVGEIELVIPRASQIGNQTVILTDVNLSFNGRKIIDGFSHEFMPYTKVGIIGPNGVGKSSLLKIITGELAPDSGMVKLAPALEFNYIDQNKVVLDPEKSCFEEISEGVETINLGGEKISVWGYLRRFLFEDERINTLIKYLSGGEKARLVLAKILKKGGNFLILDEPTNDLDLSSLRLLEEALQNYDGTLIVVSHDRYFLNRVCDTIMAFEGEGHIQVQVGDFDYYQEKKQERLAKIEPEKPTKSVKIPAEKPPKLKPQKLSFKEQRELEQMEDNIAKVEAEISEIENIFVRADFFEKYQSQASDLKKQLDGLRFDLEALYLRWDELEKKQKEFSK